MCHRITQYAETNRRIDIATDRSPIPQVIERVDFFRVFLFHVIPNECEGPRTS